MTTTPRDSLAATLSDLTGGGTFSTRRTAPPDGLHIDVRGVGPLRLPVPAEQARQLRAVARPASYGKGASTLTDRTVRDTWQVPKARVTIDKARWNGTLQPMLEQVRSDLGLPEGSRLAAQLHSMLLYEPGQFFVPHQDSEKADDMVATLVVMLPAASRGGSLIVEHRGQRAEYRSSAQQVTFVAFYADCRHEVRPLTSGHRVVLTYNLLLRGHADAGGTPGIPTRTRAALSACLDDHFADATSPDTRLVYLLDHQYTPRGLDWRRLKGMDATRAAALRSAADDADCTATLALAEVHESWTAYQEDNYYRSRRGYRRSWYDEQDPDDDGDEEPGDTDDYELDELIESTVVLTGWLDEPGAPAQRIAKMAGDDEVCSSTPSDDLTPTTSEYEGYMGNYGNTLDRWYHRGAVVIWPRGHDFAVRAAASPIWAVNTLMHMVEKGELAPARESAATVERFWAQTIDARTHLLTVETPAADPGTDAALLGRTLELANGLNDRALTTMLLAPFRLESLEPTHAPALAELSRRDPESLKKLLDAWTQRGGFGRYGMGGTPLTWLTRLPALCTGLCDADAAHAATLLLDTCWTWLETRVEEQRTTLAPSRRDAALAELAVPVAAALRSMSVTDAADLRGRALAALCRGDDTLLGLVMAAVRLVARQPKRLQDGTGWRALIEHATTRLQASLARPERDPDDWTITPPPGCGCELCRILAAFLADAVRREFAWPIAEAKRRHIHGRINAHELPVRHETVRKGSPYTLVLTKLPGLHTADRKAREKAAADLTWLREW